MLLTVTTTHRPATDLGYLLFKHPDRVQEFRRSFGMVTVFYPEASDERCTVAVLLEIDPVRLARSVGRDTPDFSLAQYVNDRSYAASSLLGVAVADVFSTARSGRGDDHQELADTPIPLEIAVPVLPCRGGPSIARRVFEPLGWQVEAEPVVLDDRFGEWGDSRYVSLRLTGTVRLADALNQLHVLLPVMDESKHYWQGDDEVDKLLRSGGGWLTTHPDAELITRRYLGRRSGLTRHALARLAELSDEVPETFEPADDEEIAPPAANDGADGERAVQPSESVPVGADRRTPQDVGQASAERREPLNVQRHRVVQAATPDAFDVLGYVVGVRLRRGLLTVVDATNVQPAARASLVALAKSHDVLVDAIVLDVPEAVALARNQDRPERDIPPRAVSRQYRDLKRSSKTMRKEGFRRVHVLRGPEIDTVRVGTEKPWNDRRELSGPFDVVGDVHGCLSELRRLLDDLGWQVTQDETGRAVGAQHPQGRTAVFVGDLVDRGPDTPGVLRLVMGMVADGTALCVSGNHEVKLLRALKGAKVQVTHGLAESLAQIEAEGDGFRSAVVTFLDGLISHYVLDDGRLVVAHAGLKQAYHGRSSGRVRSFALYGDTTGETDEYGLPVRYPWAREYRGSATVVYGHVPTLVPQWVNNTICLDTGAVFGGSLTALRYPERELVSVPAAEQYYEPARPFTAGDAVVPEREPTALDIDDVAGTRWLVTEHAGKVKIPAENAAAALEVMSRFAVDPRWLVYLPPTMSPALASTREGFLEHPEQAFAEYAAAGVRQVVCEEKHMGSRAVAVLTRDEATAAQRFGVADGRTGVVYTRTGRAFFGGDLGTELVDRLRTAAAPLSDALDTGWLVLDCELLSWSAKALGLVKDQYASVGAAAHTALPAAADLLAAAAGRGLDVSALAARVERRAANAEAYRNAYAAYVRPTDGLDGVTLAPFQILAAEGRALAVTQSHRWHLEQIATLTDLIVTPTRHRYVDLSDEAQQADAVRWWLDLTAAGGEGMVVKPVEPAGVGRRAQPGLKVRGREYLRIIYGPDYTDSLDVLRRRSLGRKQNLALREHGLGVEALTRFVAGQPLWSVHQMVFAVLALESEPVDPRL